MAQELEIKHKLYAPYVFMLGIYLLFILLAFLLDSPRNIAEGLFRIITSRAILISDYFVIGGVGATLINAVLVGCFSICLMVGQGIKPNGGIMMAIWMTTGFAFFGKNIFNMIPITFGVYLLSRFEKRPFRNYALSALLSSTLCPVVSEPLGMEIFSIPLAGVIVGILMGMLVGFIFPPIAAYTIRVHNGYCLYNLGFCGGIIAAFITFIFKSLGVEIVSVRFWSDAYDREMAVFLYVISAILIVMGIVRTHGRRRIGKDMLSLMKQTGRFVSDFYLEYGDSVYLNMGILCAASTTIMLLLGCNLSGPTIGGIFTISGFGAFGKHPRNVLPILAGAVFSTWFNTWDATAPSNTLAVLFSTGIAPIAGQYGWVWGIIAGFLHVNVANSVGVLNSGLNLYNNGLAGGLVCIVLLPLIDLFRKEKDE